MGRGITISYQASLSPDNDGSYARSLFCDEHEEKVVLETNYHLLLDGRGRANCQTELSDGSPALDATSATLSQA